MDSLLLGFVVQEKPLVIKLQRGHQIQGRSPRQLWIVGGLELAPAQWLTPGFWDRYFDGEKEAFTAFNVDAATIMASQSP